MKVEGLFIVGRPAPFAKRRICMSISAVQICICKRGFLRCRVGVQSIRSTFTTNPFTHEGNTCDNYSND